MFIDEIPEATNMSIQVQIVNSKEAGSNMTFVTEVIKLEKEDTRVLSNIGRYIAVTPIEYEDKYVSFIGDNIVCDISCTINGNPYRYNNIKIKLIELPVVGKVHIILCDKEGKIHNRRGEYRQYLGIEGDLVFTENHIPRRVIIKDLSVIGIGIVVPNDFAVNENSFVVVSWSDMIKTQGGRVEEYSYKVQGVIVHVNAISETKKLIGIRLTGSNSRLSRYINSKQLLSLSRKNA